MAQIFSAAADLRLRAAAIVFALTILAASLVGGGYVNSSYLTRVGWTQHQPVPFSHQHHVGGLGIDCRYCHTTVEVSSERRLPPTHTCMTCHSQIWTGAADPGSGAPEPRDGEPLRWNRVAKVPDYVFFNHAIHVNRGVPCVTCHGRVDQMRCSTGPRHSRCSGASIATAIRRPTFVRPRWSRAWIGPDWDPEAQGITAASPSKPMASTRSASILHGVSPMRPRAHTASWTVGADGKAADKSFWRGLEELAEAAEFRRAVSASFLRSPAAAMCPARHSEGARRLARPAGLAGLLRGPEL